MTNNRERHYFKAEIGYVTARNLDILCSDSDDARSALKKYAERIGFELLPLQHGVQKESYAEGFGTFPASSKLLCITVYPFEPITL